GTDTGGKIDYVFTAPDVQVLDAQILHDNVNGRYPSDHFPVTAKVRFAAGTTYYIDSKSGADGNPGTSSEKAWKSLGPVNARVFEPGDRILFKAGTVYTGGLKLQGSGSEGNPIVVDMYGEGPKPRIDGEGIRDTVLLENVEYWELNNLEITNLGQTRADWRTGVRLSANNYGTIHHIHLRKLHVHDVNGSNKKSREGCGIFFDSKGRKRSRFDDLLIEDCHLVRTDRNGICGRSSFITRGRNWYPSLKVVIWGNLLEDIGGDCIKPWGCDGCIVERNVVRGGRRRAEDAAAGIWPWSCDNTVIQFNEVSGMKGTRDGQGFDSDYNSRNSLFQYNYSHDNDGGFMLICTPEVSRSNIGTIGTVIRYNISYNDGARIFRISGPVSNTRIYNNVFHVPEGRDIYAVRHDDWRGWADDTHFYNNIFYVEGKVRYEFGRSTGNVFSHNVFYGKHENRPNDPHAITTDPLLVNPAGGHGFDSLEGYRLRQASPSIDAGIAIKDAGTRDFQGKRLPQGRATDIGAFEIE
ncbi:MAG: choice-of-anchor Q domain-containing protein, partial [Planctomycetota bacterium]